MAEPSSEPRLRHFFPTHVVAEPWPDFGLHGPALREAMLSRAGLDPASPATVALRDHISARITAMTVDTYRDTRRRLRWAAELSSDRMAAGDARDLRSHPGFIWAAVCLIDDGYAGSADPELGGELAFLDPRYPMVRMRTPELRTRRPDGGIDQHEVRLRPATGQIILFPAWLAHAVRPFHGSGRRLSIGLAFRAEWAA